MENRVLLERKIEGTRRRGRQRNTWGRDILKWTDKSYEECVRLAGQRCEWSHGRPPPRDGTDLTWVGIIGRISST